MEASALHARAGSGRAPRGPVLLRLRSDEQLLALFRAGSDEAFRHLHDRYRQRLFAYVRQMLAAGSRQDAEDVLQDVFVRAYGALRRDGRDVNVRAWLYRVAHNRCIDHLRRPVPPPAEIFEISRKPLHDPVEEAQRREDLRRLVEDVGRLPHQQRSALLMREIDGMSYADLADALDVTVPAVKSLLVRARIGLVEAAEARDADCGEIREDLLSAYDRGVKASARARKHMRTCSACTEYRVALRGMKRSFAALTPAGAGPLALLAQLAGLGGAGGSALAGGGGAAAGSGVVAGATACKVAAVVCTAALAGGAVEVHEHRTHPAAIAAAHRAEHRSQTTAAASTVAAAPAVSGAVGSVALRTTAAPAASAPTAGRDAAAAHAAERRAAARRRAKAQEREDAASAPVTAPDQTGLVETAGPQAVATPEPTGGTQAPADPAATAPAAATPGANPTPAATTSPTTGTPATTADTPAPAASAQTDPGSTGGAVAPGP